MPITIYNPKGGITTPTVDYFMAGNSFTYKSGDCLGILSGTSDETDASPAGTVRRLGASVGGTESSLPIILANGILGFVWNDDTSDANGNIIAPALLSAVSPVVQPNLALPSYGFRHGYMPAVAGVQRGAISVWIADEKNAFIQRHKKGTRVNSSLIGKLAALTYNATTLEFEVDTTAGNPSVVVVDMAPFYKDNRTLYDSATFATDANGAWLVFKVITTVQALPNGLTYPD